MFAAKIIMSEDYYFINPVGNSRVKILNNNLKPYLYLHSNQNKYFFMILFCNKSFLTRRVLNTYPISANGVRACDNN